MNKSGKIMMIIVIILFITGLILYFYLRSYLPKYKWVENYHYQNDQPYGLKLFYDILSESRDKKDFILINQPPQKVLGKNDTSSLYIFIGANFIINSEESKLMADFVQRGNNVFIASVNSTHLLYDIFTDSEYSTIYINSYLDSLVNIRFTDSMSQSNFKFNYHYAKKLALHNWFGIDSLLIADTLSQYGFEQMSVIDYELVDCYRIKYGEGWFVFQHNPVLFSNYYVREVQGLNYVNSLLSRYNKQKIYWDEYSKSPLKNDLNYVSGKSALQFILSERSLRWSWYLLCIFTLIYVVFNSKRKQANIPLLPDNNNTTVEYIRSLATMHYKNNSIVYLADEMLRQFQSFVKNKYGISPQVDKKEIPKQLAARSGVPVKDLKKLIENYMHVKYTMDPVNKDLIEFYKSLEFFYQNCK